jgi:hypothetical protein
VTGGQSESIDNPTRPLAWQAGIHSARCAARCGARTRSGGSCQQPAMPNRRCRMHGGSSPGAPTGPKKAAGGADVMPSLMQFTRPPGLPWHKQSAEESTDSSLALSVELYRNSICSTCRIACGCTTSGASSATRSSSASAAGGVSLRPPLVRSSGGSRCPFKAVHFLDS